MYNVILTKPRPSERGSIAEVPRMKSEIGIRDEVMGRAGCEVNDGVIHSAVRSCVVTKREEASRP